MSEQMIQLRLCGTEKQRVLHLLEQMPVFHGDNAVAEAVGWFSGQGYRLNGGVTELMTKTVLSRFTDQERRRFEERQNEEKARQDEHDLRFEAAVRSNVFVPTATIHKILEESSSDSPEAEALCALLIRRGVGHRPIDFSRRYSKLFSLDIELTPDELRLLLAKPTARFAYQGSNSAVTKRVLKQLESQGWLGQLAAALFRTQKASARAKRYRGKPRRGGQSFRTLSYQRKNEDLGELCVILEDGDGLVWGWKADESTTFAPHVLYVELPTGQVSFHSPIRYTGSDFLGTWDESSLSEERIVEFCDAILLTPETERSTGSCCDAQ